MGYNLSIQEVRKLQTSIFVFICVCTCVGLLKSMYRRVKKGSVEALTQSLVSNNVLLEK